MWLVALWLKSIFLPCVVATTVEKTLVNIWEQLELKAQTCYSDTEWYCMTQYGTVIDTGFKGTLEGTFALILCLL